MLPYNYSNLGRTIFNNKNVEAAVMRGRGAEQTWYRTYNSKGVNLHGFSKPGAMLILDPPLLEAPAEKAWRVGLIWQGKSNFKLFDDNGEIQSEGNMNYKYVVQDRRVVTTPAGKFRVWMVTRQMNDSVGGMFPATQQYWFAPYIGEIKTAEGLLLVDRNFKSKE